MKRCFSILLIIGIIISAFQLTIASDEIDDSYVIIKESIILSEPIIKDQGEYNTIELKESTSTIKKIGYPNIPIITKIFTLPFGSKIDHIEIEFSKEKTIYLQKDVLPFFQPPLINSNKDLAPEIIKDNILYDTYTRYPEQIYDYTIGSGLVENNHVMILTIHIYPFQYDHQQDLLIYRDKIELKIVYKPQLQQIFPENADLLIIVPDEYTDEIQPLISHKKSHQIDTIYLTTEKIYSDYPGRDKIEQIKYCIKENIESQGITYVLLIGSIYKVPIRTSHVSLWGRWVEETITDLYYADIYNSKGEFSTWDTNGNNIFGEYDEDEFDLYPDVHIGRLACEDIAEVKTVVDKIITYEQDTFYQDWYHDMIYIGGNTFRWNPGNEGEDLNEMVMDLMPDFTPSSIIWTSKRNFNRKTISGSINQGAGFLYYSGHGFEHGMGTYPPIGVYLRTYLTPYIEDLNNGYELPVIFFDACLTSKLDFILQDLLDYKQYRVFDILAKIFNYNTNIILPCYAWYFIQHEDGGAIATIGATRTAFGGFDSGAGKIALEFFKGYQNDLTLGQIMTHAQNEYIIDVPEDEFTVEEFILLGDPSLKLGGYE